MKKRSFSYWRSKLVGTLAGQLLISHPLLDDEQFKKTVIFIESENTTGICGFILNRPLNFMLKALGDEFSDLDISNTPVYSGGEDEKNTVMLTAWVTNRANKTFEIYYGLAPEEAQSLIDKHDNVQFRAYLGCCEFGQTIYDDIEKGLWLLSSPKLLLGRQEHKDDLWKSMLLQESPNALVYK